MPARDETAWEPVVGDHGDDVAYQRVRLSPTAQPTDEAQTAVEANPDYDATDGAVEAAKELGIELADVKGTGADGRITKSDVEAAAGD